MSGLTAYFITWTTYGTWLPGDHRGWRKWKVGNQQPQPQLEQWCRNRLNEKPIVLNESQREKVEIVCCEHAVIRGWQLHAVSARSNHIHLAVTADEKPKKVQDKFKANATRVLREAPDPVLNTKIWARGGDIDFVDGQDSLEQVILYITVAQDRIERGKF